MTITINGSGTITGLSAGGLPDATIVTADIVDANVTQAKLETLVVPIGVGQTWQTFSIGSTRVYGTTYTNTTGRPIVVSWSTANCGNSAYNLVIAGNTFQYASCGNLAVGQNLSGVVPSGATYVINLTSGSATTPIWSELR